MRPAHAARALPLRARTRDIGKKPTTSKADVEHVSPRATWSEQPRATRPPLRNPCSSYQTSLPPCTANHPPRARKPGAVIMNWSLPGRRSGASGHRSLNEAARTPRSTSGGLPIPPEAEATRRQSRPPGDDWCGRRAAARRLHPVTAPSTSLRSRPRRARRCRIWCKAADRPCACWVGSHPAPSKRAEHPPATGGEASTPALASLPSRTSSGNRRRSAAPRSCSRSGSGSRVAAAAANRH